MREVTYIPGKDHAYTVHLPNGTPFYVEFIAGVGGHYPVGSGWTKGIPDEVAEAWQANMQPSKSGFIISPPAPAKPAPKPRAKAAPKKKAVKK